MENRILETSKLRATFAAFCLLCTSAVAAQAPQTGPLIFDIDGGAVHQSMTDLKDSEGSFAVDRWFVSAGITYAWDRRNALGFTLGGGSSSYEFDDLTGPAGSEPWNKIEETRAAITGRFSFSDKGTAIIIPAVEPIHTPQNASAPVSLDAVSPIDARPSEIAGPAEPIVRRTAAGSAAMVIDMI